MTSDSSNNVAASAASPVTGASTATSGTTCENCGATESWGFTSWCPRCGYYPAFKTCVDTGPRQDEPAEAISLVKLIPAWMWVLGAGIVGIFVISLAARVVLSPESGSRLFWMIAQITICLSAALVGQFAAFLSGAPGSDKASAFDVFLKPFEIWKPSIRRLPENAWCVWCVGWGLWGVLCAMVFVRGG